MSVLILHQTVNPLALETVINYRGVSKNKLCKEVKGLSRYNLDKFLEGNLNYVSIDLLRQIMNYFEWPFNFLFKDIKPIKSSLYL